MNLERLINNHFEKKPGENLEALKGRYMQIGKFHKDPVSAALLATSYYGMEELSMRLPRLNDILRNPFGEEEILHAITGLIMIADGGPAEGAKAIQIAMALKTHGIEIKDPKTAHMVALLAISCKQVFAMMGEITGKMESIKASEEGNFEVTKKDDAVTIELFWKAAQSWLQEEQRRQEVSADETEIAYALLVGMKEEVETVFDEEL